MHWCGSPIYCVDHVQIGWINTIAWKLLLLATAKAWMCRSVGFVTATWLLYLIIGVSFVNWRLIMEKDISKIVIVKQDPIDLEAMLKKFSLKDSDYTLIPCLRMRENEMYNILLHCCLHYFWAFPAKLLVCIHPLVFCHRFISNSSFISSFLCDLIKYYFPMVTSTHKSH